MSASSRIRDLVQAKLIGRKIDVVAFMDELLAITVEAGEIRCYLTSEKALRFELRDGETCDVELDACRGKLRMLCARLGVLCNESGGGTVSPYGGDGVIRLTSQNGKGPKQWTARFKNTPADHEFTISSATIEMSQVAGVNAE